MKEKILEALHEIGFKLEELDSWYGFSYEGTRYLYMPNDDDENFMSFGIPGLYEMEEERELEFYKLLDKINSTMKYTKCYQINNNLWLFDEREIFGNEDFTQLVSSTILHLDAALNFTRKAISEMHSDDNANNE